MIAIRAHPPRSKIQFVISFSLVFIFALAAFADSATTRPQDDDQTVDKYGWTPQLESVSSRMIELTIAIYNFSKEHQGMLPHNLGQTLSMRGDEALMYLTPADLEANPPPTPLNADWINQHASFIYIAADVPLPQIKLPGTTIMLYSKLDHPYHHPKRGDVVLAFYIDGHGEILTVADAKVQIEKSKQILQALHANAK
jgi:hypothetical protein